MKTTKLLQALSIFGSRDTENMDSREIVVVEGNGEKPLRYRFPFDEERFISDFTWYRSKRDARTAVVLKVQGSALDLIEKISKSKKAGKRSK